MTTTYDLAQAYKEAGTQAANANADQEWTHRANTWLANWPFDQFTADDLVRAVGQPVGSSNQIGARFRAWKEAGLILAIGYRKSTRATNHGRPVAIWAVCHY